MVNSKDKGTGFERDLVKYLNTKLKGKFKRIANSGALGTNLNEPLLTGDVTGEIAGFPKKVKIECKVGYGGEKQLTLKREWLVKIKKESEQAYAFPILIGKFSGARKADGVQTFAVLDIDDLTELFNMISDMSDELELLYNEKKKSL